MDSLLTKHLDIWTTAQTPKVAGDRGRGRKANGKLGRHGMKKLRELILELAVRGKLVPQDSSDEPASVLLEKIAKEKGRLIEEGKIKKQKKLPEISTEEKPFELPDGWEWARLPDVSSYKPGKTPSTKNSIYWSDDSDDIPWVSISDMEHYGRVTSTNKKITQEAKDQVFKYSAIPAGSLLMSFKLTIGKISILDLDAYHNEAIISIQPFTGMKRDYLFKFLPSRALAGNTKKAIKGNTLNATSLALLLLPVPPLPEQHRIVAKVDELMALCDRLEQQQTDSNATHQTLLETLLAALTTAADHDEFAGAWQRIKDHFHTLFSTEQSIDQLKQTILQLAVMGKLVRQSPSDEPASVLLEKIAKEKAQLIKEGKIKKQKKLPEISEEEKPFDLPEGWEWARFPDIGEFGRGKSKHRPRNDPSLYENGQYPLVQTGDVARANGVVRTYTALYNDNGLSQSRLWPKGTMCITIAANIADSSILGFDACFPDSVVGLVPFSDVGDTRYFEYFMRTAKEHLMDFAPSTAQKNINLGILEKVYIPLPPAKEINRIVAKVDELMTLCDTLKARLSKAQTIQIHLADTMFEQAVSREADRDD